MPATKQVLVWIIAGRFMRLAKAMTFLVPSTLVLSADSSGGLNVTRPDELISTSMSLATRSASSSLRPRFFSVMSPSTTRTLVRRNSASPRATVTRAQRIERRRRDHALPEPRLAIRPRPAPHHDVNRPTSGKRSSSMLSSTLPTKPVLPRMNRFRPRRISVADSGGGAGAGKLGRRRTVRIVGGFVRQKKGSLDIVPSQDLPVGGAAHGGLAVAIRAAGTSRTARGHGHGHGDEDTGSLALRHPTPTLTAASPRWYRMTLPRWSSPPPRTRSPVRAGSASRVPSC